MKDQTKMVLAMLIAATSLVAQDGAHNSGVSAAGPVIQVQSDDKKRAAARYDEMLSKMTSAIEEIAQLYGNPTFLQVFTNDRARASELKERLKVSRSREELEHDIRTLVAKREEILGDIALRNREVLKLTDRLVRQRSALDALSAAVDQAKEAVEGTVK